MCDEVVVVRKRRRRTDSSTGIFRGSCSIGEWTKYEKVEDADEAG